MESTSQATEILERLVELGLRGGDPFRSGPIVRRGSTASKDIPYVAEVSLGALVKAVLQRSTLFITRLEQPTTRRLELGDSPLHLGSEPGVRDRQTGGGGQASSSAGSPSTAGSCTRAATGSCSPSTTVDARSDPGVGSISTSPSVSTKARVSVASSPPRAMDPPAPSRAPREGSPIGPPRARRRDRSRQLAPSRPRGAPR